MKRCMLELGRRGGRARAKALDHRRRSAIARGAAQVRWEPKILMLRHPRNHEELQCFVAQYGNGVARAQNCDLIKILLRAITACRNDACLARMLPVFIWRARKQILTSITRFRTTTPTEAATLGYLLELTSRLGKIAIGIDLSMLRKKSTRLKEPIVLFHFMNTPALRKFAAGNTSPLARSWKLVLGEPDESFESYFQKMIHAAL